MFWNNEFLNAAPSVFDTLLQSESTKLSDILFHEDLLQELRTSNLELINYLSKPETINELVDNITRLTEKDCYDKSLYSRVHAAYISCEILTAGANEITDALLSQTNTLTKIISCLVRQPCDDDDDDDNDNDNDNYNVAADGHDDKSINLNGTTDDGQGQHEDTNDENKANDNDKDADDTDTDKSQLATNNTIIESNKTQEEGGEGKKTEEKFAKDEEKGGEVKEKEERGGEGKVVAQVEHTKDNVEVSPIESKTDPESQLTAQRHPATAPSPPFSSTPSPTLTSSTLSATIPPIESIKVVPQKAALVSKLISNIHSTVPADLSCPITKNMELFSSLIQVLVNNIDVSGSFEILSTFISRTNPPELRYVFCEILSKLNFVFSLINVMTLSSIEDKQRNACQLLCDIIVIGRQEASEQLTHHGPASQDMLAELIESREAVLTMLKQMFPRELTNSTETNCLDSDRNTNANDTNCLNENSKTMNSNETNCLNKSSNEAICQNSHSNSNSNEATSSNSKPDHMINADEQTPIAADTIVSVNGSDASKHDDENDSNDDVKKQNGISETANEIIINGDINGKVDGKPDETVPETPNRTAIVCGMKVLQTLVERKHAKNNTNIVTRTIEQIQDEIADNLVHFHELLLNPPKQEPIKTTFGVIQKPLGYTRLEVVNLIRELLSTGSSVIIKKLVELQTFKIIIDLFVDYSWNNLLHTQVEQAVHLIIKNCRRDEDLKYQVDMQKHSANNVVEPINHDLPSLALLSQLLNECDLIGRLLLPNKNGKQANFGHIIQMINSISISCDLDTIKDHLNEMRDKRQELYARWTNFVNVDVASFKAISLYYDVQSVSKHTDNNYEYLQKRNLSSDEHGYYLNSNQGYHRSFGSTLSNNSSSANNDNVKNLSDDDQIMTYLSFTKETVIPSINVDVLPYSRRTARESRCDYN